MAVAVLVLEPLALQRRAAGRRAHEEAARTRVRGRPDQVTHALEAEHRVEDEERQRARAVHRRRRPGGDERGQRPRLGDAFLEDLTVRRLLVVDQAVGIDGLVELAHVRVDAGLAEQRLHAEGARLVGDDRHDQIAHRLVAQQPREQPHEGERGRDIAAAGALVELVEDRVGGGHAGTGDGVAQRQEATEGEAALLQVARLRAVVVGAVERRTPHLLVTQRNAEAVAEEHQFVCVEPLLLVGDVLALARLAETVALDRAGKHDGRRALLAHGGVVGGVDLRRIVAAEAHRPQLVVAHVLDHAQQARVHAVEVLADIGAAGDGVLLVLAIDDLAHALRQQAVVVLRQQRIPLGAPEHLDHVPARAAEDRFELRDDLAVAADGAVEALQVAVDHEDQVVEPLPRRQRDRAQRLRLVRLAVAEEDPDLRVRRLLEPAVYQVAHEARLVDPHQRREAHRDGREHPEVFHQPGVGVRGQPPALGELAAEVEQLLVAEPSLEVGAGRRYPARRDPGCRPDRRRSGRSRRGRSDGSRPRRAWLRRRRWEMWPPMPSARLLASTTIAIAFQRTKLLMRCSITRLPG